MQIKLINIVKQLFTEVEVGRLQGRVAARWITTTSHLNFGE